jgi:DNA-directed RNA polymerase specialized sigma24 family protein
MKETTRQQINKLIYDFRKGDKKSEQILYERYKKRVQLYVYKNVWFKGLKDPDSLIEDILSKLFRWFRNNKIEKSESAVIYNIVRRECDSQGKKDKREPAVDFEPRRSSPDNDKNKKNRVLLEINRKMVNDNSFFSSNPGILSFSKLNLLVLLSKCLKRLTKRQRKVIDYYFFHGYTYAEIGTLINRSNVAAFNCVKAANESLMKCLKEHGINSLSDLK